MRATTELIHRFPDRRGAFWLAALALALGGCASPPPAGAAANGKEAIAAKAAADPKSTTPLGPADRANALRDQAERDVEALGKLRASAGETGPAEPASAAAAPDIMWNAPARAAARQPAARQPAPGDDQPASAAVLPRPRDTIEVQPPPALHEQPGADPLALDRLDVRLVQLRQDLYRKSIDSDQPIRELLAIAAMSLIDPELDLPSGVDRELSAEELELLGAFHEFYVGLGRDLNAQSPAAETIVSAIRTLQTTAVDQPRLALPAAELCWRIGGFGDFDAFDRAVFLAHAEQQLILYLEIDDFASEQNKNGEWVTQVSQQLEIYSDRDGIPVWSEPWQKAVDRVHKPRRDFFTTQLITIPKALSVGKYQLKIRVRDENSGAEAEESVPFEMVADPKLAAQVGG